MNCCKLSLLELKLKSMRMKTAAILLFAASAVSGSLAADDAPATEDSTPDENVSAKETSAPADVPEEEASSETTQSENKPGSAWVFNGFATEEYRFRYAAEPTVSDSVLDAGMDSSQSLRRGADHDFRLFFGGNARDRQDRFWVNASFGLFADLDGYTPAGETTALSSTHENAASVMSLAPGSPAPLWFDMYSLFGEYHSDGVLASARAGRQESGHGRSTTFDGAAMDIHAVKSYLDFFAFGGRSIHFFEIDADLYEDWLASVGSVIRPMETLKFELEYRFHAEDYSSNDNLIGDEAAETAGRLVNHTYSLTGWYRLDDLLYLKGYFRGIGDTPAETGGTLSLNVNPVETGLDLKADAQLTTFGEVNELDDPYYAILGESLPHVRLNADLWKAFTTNAGIYTLHGGWAARILTKGTSTAFNRDFGRAYISFDAADIAVKGPFISAMGEFYYTNADSERFFTAGGSAGYDKRPVRLEAGTYYQWVKYKYYADVEEVEDVRTYFAELRLKPVKWFSIRMKYELEQFDRLVHTAMLTLSQAN